MLKMDLEYKNAILFVRLNGKLDHEYSYKINNYLNPVIEKHKIKYLVYNLFGLDDIDEEGIDALKQSKEKILANDGKIALCEVNKNLSKLLKNVKIETIKNELVAFQFLEV